MKRFTNKSNVVKQENHALGPLGRLRGVGWMRELISVEHTHFWDLN